MTDNRLLRRKTGMLVMLVAALALGSTRQADAQVAGGNHWTLAADPLVGPLPDGPVIDVDHRYTLPELIDLAEGLNPETRMAWAEAREALSAEGVAKSAFLPRLSAAVLGAYASGSSYASAGGIGGRVSADTSGAIGVLNLQWLMFDFGERAAAVRASDERRQFGDLRLTEAHQRLIHAVTVAYYAHMAMRAQLTGCAQSVVDALEVEEASAARYRRGVGTVIEVDQARQASAEARLTDIQALGAANDSYLALLAAMGLSPLRKITIADLPDRILAQHLVSEVDAVVNAALSRRPDVREAYAAREASRDDVKAARAAQRPKFFVTATGSYAIGDLALSAIPSVGGGTPTLNLSGHHLGGTIFAGVSVPLYDGGVRRAALEGAHDRADAAQAGFERAELEAARQIATAHNQLATALEAGAASVFLLQSAQTTFDATSATYSAGVGALSEVLLAHRQLIAARNLATDARFKALTAAATLALSVGELASVGESR